jgi:protein-disulfide isomerase
MKSLAVSLVLFTLAAVAGAAPVNDPEVQKYLSRYFMKCPDARITLETFDDFPPKGFVAYRATQTSSSNHCGGGGVVLVSRASGQILVGDMLRLPFDLRPAEARLAEMGTNALKVPVRAVIDATALNDGLRRVALRVDTSAGPFSYGGFLDASQRYMIVGRLGNLKVDPGVTLLETLGLHGGAVRGSKDAPVTIVELSDLQCPACRRAHTFVEKFAERNQAHVRYIRLDLPLFQSHDWSLKAALAARAINHVSPSHYAAYVNHVFGAQNHLTAKNIDELIGDFVAGNSIDEKKFGSVYNSAAERKALLEQVGRAFDAGITGTPTFIVNGQMIFYGSDGDYLLKHLESLIPGKR